MKHIIPRLPSKWIYKASPNDRPADVAVHTLKNRLKAVLLLLPLAAKRSDTDVEYVHQLRVWTRRAAAAMVLYRDLMPRRRCQQMRKLLKRIRRSVDTARNCDVQISRLEQIVAVSPDPDNRLWLETVRADRLEAQKSVISLFKRLKRVDGFDERVRKLLKSIRKKSQTSNSGSTDRFGKFASRKLTSAVNGFFDAIPADSRDQTALHRFRIAGKQLRYTLELLIAVVPERFRTEACPAIQELQDRLGRINDSATSLKWLKDQHDRADGDERAAAWKRLIDRERAKMEDDGHQFQLWFSSQVEDQLKNALKM